MCLLFVYVNNNAVDADEYQVVIAMNRDEFIDRPTLPAHFWNEHCISGLLVSFTAFHCLKLQPAKIYCIYKSVNCL